MVATAPASVEVRGNGPMDLLRLALRHNLYPELQVHPSWWPSSWPLGHRPTLAEMTPAAHAVLADVLRQCGLVESVADFDFDSRLKRLMLVDGAAIRRLAFYVSLCAHAPLMQQRRNTVATALRRQARRFDADAVEFVLERTPRLSALQMSPLAFEERPRGCGRVLVDRGYRLLLATVASEGAGVVTRMQRRLPRRVASLSLPTLTSRQSNQISELMLACIVPERLAQWDWLF